MDLDFFNGMEDVIIIDVRQKPEPFIDQLIKCEYIVSSSLHGLILADSYQIPNKWAAFSDKITGGSFKFRDYYSTTDSAEESCFLCIEEDRFKELICNIEKYASVKNYIYDREELTKSFPVF
jgi:pyruvyltransferase